MGCRLILTLLLISIALACGPASGAMAQSFDFHAPESKRGELELESINGANLGAAKGSSAFVRNAHQIKLNNGLTDFWRLEVGAVFERPEPAELRLARLSFENTFVLRPVQKNGVGIGWFAALDVATSGDTHNAVVFGPVVQVNAGNAMLLVNPFFEKTFGHDSEPGLALTYVWRGKYELWKGVGIGAAGHGRIEHLGSALPWSEQDHRLGPALFLDYEVTRGREIDISLGVLFGVTHASPDASVMLNVGVPLGRR